MAGCTGSPDLLAGYRIVPIGRVFWREERTTVVPASCPLADQGSNCPLVLGAPIPAWSWGSPRSALPAVGAKRRKSAALGTELPAQWPRRASGTVESTVCRRAHAWAWITVHTRATDHAASAGWAVGPWGQRLLRRSNAEAPAKASRADSPTSAPESEPVTASAAGPLDDFFVTPTAVVPVEAVAVCAGVALVCVADPVGVGEDGVGVGVVRAGIVTVVLHHARVV